KAIRRRPADIAHGAAAPSLRGGRLERNTGGGPFLDHHHDPGTGRLGHTEAAMSDFSISSIRSDAPTLILGLGLTGVAAARWCARHGAPLRVLDTCEAPAGLDALREDLAAANV